jgi:hypothetical protein
MQKITIKEITYKTGTNDKGDWKLTQITGADGAKFASFDHKAADLKAGDTIEAEIEIKGKNNNIKSFNILEHGTAPAPASPAPANSNTTYHGKTTEMLDKELDSKYRNTALMSAVDLFKNFEVTPSGQKGTPINAGEYVGVIINTAQSFYNWLINPKPIPVTPRPPINGPDQRPANPAPQPAKSNSDAEKAWDNIPSGGKTGRNPDSIKTSTDLIKAAHEDFGLQPNQLMAELNIHAWAGLTLTPAAAYKQIAATRQGGK